MGPVVTEVRQATDIIDLDPDMGVKLDASCMDRAEATRKAYDMGLEAGRTQAPRSTSAGEELDHFMDRMKLRGTRGFKGDFVATDGTRIHFEVEFERPQRQVQHPEFERG